MAPRQKGRNVGPGTLIEEPVREDLSSAISILLRLGKDFGTILEESGVRRVYLEQLFRLLGYETLISPPNTHQTQDDEFAARDTSSTRSSEVLDVNGEPSSFSNELSFLRNADKISIETGEEILDNRPKSANTEGLPNQSTKEGGTLLAAQELDFPHELRSFMSRLEQECQRLQELGKTEQGQHDIESSKRELQQLRTAVLSLMSSMFDRIGISEQKDEISEKQETLDDSSTVKKPKVIEAKHFQRHVAPMRKQEQLVDYSFIKLSKSKAHSFTPYRPVAQIDHGHEQSEI